MSGLPQDFLSSLTRETWALYGLGVAIISVRLYARIRKCRLRGLDVDDYMMLVALIFYTILIVFINLTANSAGSALVFPGEDVYALSPSEIRAHQVGAKFDLVAEQGMLNTIWCLKCCMLYLYYRLTQGLKSRMFVKILAIYTAVGYVAVQMTYFLQCRPFSSYWQIVPPPNLNCMTLWTYAIVQCTFNISSDVAMLLIPLPLIVGVKVPIRQKLVLLVVFSMGIFVIAAALCTKIVFFTDVYSASYLFWYTREASVAVYVTNLPCIWPLLRELMPVLRSWTPGGVSSKSGRPRTTNMGGTNTSNTMRRHNNNHIISRQSADDIERIAHPFELNTMGDDKGQREPRVTAETDDDKSSARSSQELPGTIRYETTIEIHSSDRSSIERLV